MSKTIVRLGLLERIQCSMAILALPLLLLSAYLSYQLIEVYYPTGSVIGRGTPDSHKIQIGYTLFIAFVAGHLGSLSIELEERFNAIYVVVLFLVSLPTAVILFLFGVHPAVSLTLIMSGANFSTSASEFLWMFALALCGILAVARPIWVFFRENS